MLEDMIAIIQDQLDCRDITITAATSFKNDLAADSLDLFELGMAVEEKFGVEIPSEEFANMSTVGDVVDYVESHKE